MDCLTNLFQPNCLLILGIFVLALALLIVYFESKMREQNHKFSSMFSLVSALADEVNSVKFCLSQNIIGGAVNTNFLNKHLEENNDNNFKNILINVSDDEESEDDESNKDDSNKVESGNEDSDNEDSDDEDNSSTSSGSELELSDNETDDGTVQKLEINSSDLKVFKIKENTLGENELIDFDDLDGNTLENLEEKVQFENDVVTSDNKLFIPNDIIVNENLPSEFKTIHINLEEQSETLDYKKLPVNKLRDIVNEKMLTNDASKLKKNELLKLLGCE